DLSEVVASSTPPQPGHSTFHDSSNRRRRVAWRKPATTASSGRPCCAAKASALMRQSLRSGASRTRLSMASATAGAADWRSTPNSVWASSMAPSVARIAPHGIGNRWSRPNAAGGRAPGGSARRALSFRRQGENAMERRLAAVLAADVDGYSRLMEADEAGTLAHLKSLRDGLIHPTIAAHRGRIVKLMGDGTLVEFAGAADAVRCAVGLQDEVARREDGVPEAERVRLRIGINRDHVLVEDGDLFG